MALQYYWQLPLNVWGRHGTANTWVSTPPGGIGANTGVRAYCVQTSYIEDINENRSCFSDIAKYVQNGATHNGPFYSGIAVGSGVSEVTAHAQATNAAADYLLIVDVFA